MKSVVTCKLTLDHDKLARLAKEGDMDSVGNTPKEIHDVLVEGFKETILDEVDDDLGVFTIEFTDELTE